MQTYLENMTVEMQENESGLGSSCFKARFPSFPSGREVAKAGRHCLR